MQQGRGLRRTILFIGQQGSRQVGRRWPENVVFSILPIIHPCLRTTESSRAIVGSSSGVSHKAVLVQSGFPRRIVLEHGVCGGESTRVRSEHSQARALAENERLGPGGMDDGNSLLSKGVLSHPYC
ncbi:hypothetical protein HYQ46_010853 [Verticillium longisporum]|nr:hypothetical protein HYQ46_010853 [Verticillium longisporum]